MVVPLFGWSAGDIFITIQILSNVAAAFRKAGGAKDRYSETRAWLTAFSRVLERVRIYANTTHPGTHRDDISAQISIIDPHYKAFEDYLRKFDASLSSQSTESLVKSAFRTVRWSVKELKGRVDTLKRYVSDSLDQLILLLALEQAEELSSLAHAIETLPSTAWFTDTSSCINDLASNVQSLHHAIAAVQGITTHHATLITGSNQNLQDTISDQASVALASHVRLYRQVIDAVNSSTDASADIISNLSSNFDTFSQHHIDQISAIETSISDIQSDTKNLCSHYNTLSHELKQLMEGNERIERTVQTFHSDFNSRMEHHAATSENIYALLQTIRTEFNERSSRDALTRGDQFASCDFRNGVLSGHSFFNAPNADFFARVVRQQLDSVLPAMLGEMSSQMLKKHSGWFQREIPLLDRTIKSVLEESRCIFNLIESRPDSIYESHGNFRIGTPGDGNLRSSKMEIPSTRHQNGDTEASGWTSRQIFDANNEIFEPPCYQISKPWEFKWQVGTLEINISRRPNPRSLLKHQTYNFRLRFIPPKHLWQRGLNVAISTHTDPRGNPSINPHITTFAIVPEDAPAFRYAASGQIQELQQLFQQRLASPSDRSPTGQSLLAAAAVTGHGDVCRLILSENPRSFGEVEYIELRVALDMYMLYSLSSAHKTRNNRFYQRYEETYRALRTGGCDISGTGAARFSVPSKAEKETRIAVKDLEDDRLMKLSEKFFGFLKEVNDDINGYDEDGLTWLMSAALICNPGFVSLLLFNGAMATPMKAGYRWSPLQIALIGQLEHKISDKDLIETLVVLLAAGCDPNYIDARGISVGTYAVCVGKAEQFTKAMILARVDLKRFLEIKKERMGTSTALERDQPLEQLPQFRRPHRFEET